MAKLFNYPDGGNTYSKPKVPSVMRLKAKSEMRPQAANVLKSMRIGNSNSWSRPKDKKSAIMGIKA